MLGFALDDQPEDRFGSGTVDGGGILVYAALSARFGSGTVSGGGSVVGSGSGSGAAPPGEARASGSMTLGGRTRISGGGFDSEASEE